MPHGGNKALGRPEKKKKKDQFRNREEKKSTTIQEARGSVDKLSGKSLVRAKSSRDAAIRNEAIRRAKVVGTGESLTARSKTEPSLQTSNLPDLTTQQARQQRASLIPTGEIKPNPEGRTDLLKDIQEEESKLDPTAVQERTAQQGGINEFEGRGERASEFVAEKALAIPVDLVGGAIKSGLEKLTGRDIKQTSAADLAETGIGKALGISIAAASGALLVATAGGALVSATAAITGKIAVALGVSKGLVVGGGAIGLTGVTGLSKDIIIDKILDRKDVNVLLSTLTPMGETITNNVALVKSGGISHAKGIAHLNAIEEDVNILDHELQQAAILDPRVSQSGDFLKIVLEIRKLRTQTQKARGDILATIPEFNAADIALALEDLQEIEKGRSSTLIERR